MYDFIVVGQGLAGTLIGYRLEKAGKSVFYLDHPAQTAASHVAAGIVNPITGRRFVKSWQIDALLPEARTLYAALEQDLGSQFWYDLPLVRTLFNQGDQNYWDVRTGEPGYTQYMAEHPELGEFLQFTRPAFAYGEVKQTARVAVDHLVDAYRKQLKEKGRFQATVFNYEQLVFTESLLTYQGINAHEIIFCEGWHGKANPWFNYLPFRGAKGEVLRVQLPHPIATRMLKHQVFLVPQTDRTYWVGATTENHFVDDQPTSFNAQVLEDRLKNVLKIPYEILRHQAAVRPTVKDRRPFLGRHPRAPRVVIFNGLGGKGASLAPLCSRWLVEHLLYQRPLPNEVDIKRFVVK
ncbi:MAG: FAD-dependent oxidoreductase [Bacteroidota bacterium]